jgi:hypothetical protein
LLELISGDLPDDPKVSDYQREIFKTIGKFITGELDIAQYPELHGQIVEAARILTVEKLIKDKGGSLVPMSDGMSVTLRSPELDKSVQGICSQFAIKNRFA